MKKQKPVAKKQNNNIKEMKDIIVVSNISKTFKIPHDKNRSLKGAAINLIKRKGFEEFRALKGVSFTVKEGEFVGIIGRNGCGKSTLLKMIAKIYIPDAGKVVVNGRLSPFLELGVGFNPNLSARDNVYLNGTILGLTRKEIDEKFDEIIEFAELEEFVDQKLRNFSSGMQVRLAFSVAIQAHAEVLLIDEVLAVGDISFQKKCFAKFKEFKDSGKTVVFVSHSMENVERFCDRVILIEDGKINFEGGAQEAAFKYLELQNKNVTEVRTQINSPIQNVIYGEVSEPKETFYSHEEIKINLCLDKKLLKEDFNIGIGIYDLEKDCRIAGFNTYYDGGLASLGLKNKGVITLKLENGSISRGDYYILASAFRGKPKDKNYFGVFSSKIAGKSFTVIPQKEISDGAVCLNHRWV